MRIFNRLIASSLALVFIAFSSTFSLTSCIKEQVRDTTVIIIHDTIVRVDTIIQIDTVCKTDFGLVAHFNFTNGSLLDETNYHNDIVFNSAAKTSDKAGAANNAYLFDGSSGFMRVANSASLNPNRITLMARVKVNDFYMGTCHASEIIGKGYTDLTKGFYVLRISDDFGNCYNPPQLDKEFFWAGYGDNIPQGTATGVTADTSYVQLGNWYTVVYTYDGSESRIYVNGVMKGAKTNNVSFTPNDRDLFIGRHEDPAFPYWFNGVIDEVRIYNRAVNASEAVALSRLGDTDPA